MPIEGDEKLILTALCLLLSLLLEFFKLLFVFSLNLKLHLSQLDLIFVLSLGDLLVKHGTIVLPLSQLELVEESLLGDL